MRAGRMRGPEALVLGSTQSWTAIDESRAASAGVGILRRTTGGGAVFVATDAQVWLDVWVPRADVLWDDDVVQAAVWLGDAWAVGLESLGARSLVVHRGRSTRGGLADLVCFAGIGPGEVRVERAPSHRTKVMGLAQRRNRRGARFHTTAPLVWDPARLVELLDLDAPDPGEPDEVAASLADAAVGLRALLPDRSATSDVELITSVEDAVIAALP
ncbi:MAG TPA: hypothetical protein VID75_05880 [Acidimicrobiales bacterium]